MKRLKFTRPLCFTLELLLPKCLFYLREVSIRPNLRYLERITLLVQWIQEQTKNFEV
jgi:hypothetical protein